MIPVLDAPGREPQRMADVPTRYTTEQQARIDRANAALRYPLTAAAAAAAAAAAVAVGHPTASQDTFIHIGIIAIIYTVIIYGPAAI